MVGIAIQASARPAQWAAAALVLGAACSPCLAAKRPSQARPYQDQIPLMDLMGPATTGGGVDGGGTGLIPAADNIVSLQCPNGGWAWPYGGCGSTASNITGPIGLGLLKAYQATSNTAYLTAALDAGDYALTSQYGNASPRFSTYDPEFLHALSTISGNATYSNHAATGFFAALDNGTYGNTSDWDTADWIAVVEAARTGVWINLRPWEFSTIARTAQQIGQLGQDVQFTNAILAGLNTLDSTNPNTAYSDLLGLAGGLRGLALANQTSFAPLTAPNSNALQGVDNLCDLAAVLVSFQNADGSWSWHSLLQDSAGDQDTQTTAYVVLALVAAQDAGCGPYTTQIANGRAWLWTMQDPADGGFYDYPGSGTKNIEINGEVASALGVVPELTLASNACAATGTVVVEINMSDVQSAPIVGGQFFLAYDNSVLSFVSATAGDPPFTVEIFESVNTGAGTIDYAVGVPGVGPGTTSATTMAVLTFNTLQEVCSTAGLVNFRSHTPPTQLTDDQGTPIVAALEDLHAITIDSTPPVVLGPLVYSNGFEVDTAGWGSFGPAFVANRVPSGTNGVTSAAGAFHAESSATGSAGNWGGYDFTPGQSSSGPGVTFREYITSIDIYLDINGGWANDTRFDFDSAINGSNGLHRRDFIFNGGFYNDATGPGAGTDRFVISASFNSQPGSAFAKNPAMGPIAISTTGWYTFSHRFYNNAGVLAVEMTIHDSLGNLVNSWIRSHPTDLIGLIGGNRYAWFDYNQFSVLAFDNASLVLAEMPDIEVNADAGSCSAVVTWLPPSASDNCTSPGSILVSSTHDPGDTFPTGTTTVTYTFTDLCGNDSDISFDVTVNGVNVVVADLQLSGSFSTTFTRCIRFELSSGGPGTTIVDQNVTFVNGVANDVEVEVPCGLYTCITARDRKHTLRRTDSAFAIVGVNYSAAFTGADALVGGNLNDDPWIDILDFGIFVGQFGSSPGADTVCGYVGNHADISGDGDVNVLDFNFISLNFLQGHEANCSGVSGFAGEDNAQGGPIRRISNRELIRMGLQELTAADLNHDGWLDVHDIAQFLNGQ